MGTIQVLAAIAILFTTQQIARYVYNLFFHSLHRFPGPLFCRVSSLPLAHQFLRGDGMAWILRLHNTYGNVVRISPGELSFSGVNAFQDIYGIQKGRSEPLCKDPDFYEDFHGTKHIGNSDATSHARQRRLLAPAFSGRALRMQEPLFLACADTMIAQLRQGTVSEPNRAWNMVTVYTCAVADVISDLVLGESLNTLDKLAYHPWLETLLAIPHQGVYGIVIRHFWWLDVLFRLLMIVTSDRVKNMIKDFKVFVERGIKNRQARAETRPDIWELALSHNKDGTAVSQEEMYNNAIVFMMGGVETTSTLLASLTYLLLAHPDKMKRVVDEIRGTFDTEADIKIDNLQQLEYLNACIEEGLRLFPPMPTGPPRVTPTGCFTIVDGHVIPGETKVFVTIMASARSAKCWIQPDSFVPERWLDDTSKSSPFQADNKQASQPFLLGRRGCIGKSVAYCNVRIILAKIFWNFDLSLCEPGRDWLTQKNYIVWDRPPLDCHIRLRGDIHIRSQDTIIPKSIRHPRP